MQKLIEFIILLLCVALACGIIIWSIKADNKNNPPKP